MSDESPVSTSTIQVQAAIPALLSIDGELNIYSATDLRTTLLNRLDAGKAFNVDLSRVSEIDGAGLQLLLALDREAEHRGTLLTWQGVSSAVMSALELCHISTSFPRPRLVDEG